MTNTTDVVFNAGMGNTELGSLELDVLGIVREQNLVSVLNVQKFLKKKNKNELAYTTVMTVLTRLYKKGVLSRKKEGRQYLYYQSKDGQKIGTSIFNRIHKVLFSNEKLKPILNFLEKDDDLSNEELLELKKIIDKKIKGRGTKK